VETRIGTEGSGNGDNDPKASSPATAQNSIDRGGSITAPGLSGPGLDDARDDVGDSAMGDEARWS
jgi:hypothetical protein